MSQTEDLSNLTTELINPLSTNLSSLSTFQILSVINDEDALVAAAVRKVLPQISAAIDDIVPRLRRGGRVIYFGAGTSGRLGILDASECLPTFGSERFVGIMAGGDSALRKAKEGVEDSEEAGINDLRALEMDPTRDVAVGIAASGRTPYVIGALKFAHELGCLTLGIACTSPSAMSNLLDVESGAVVQHMLAPVVGPEAVTGSTRMKAGTATKLVLNMLSTCCMVQIGKTYGNLMVDLRVSNEKLRARGRRLVRHICGTTVYVPQEVPDFVPNAGVVLSPMISLADVFLDALISYCGSSVKLAIAVGKTGLTREAATKRLLESDGLLDTVLVPERSLPDGSKAAQGPYFLCVDGGGTSTRAFISTPGRGVIASAKISRPCNVSHCGIEASVASIRAAINLALVSASPPLLSTVSFDRVWIGAAGVDPSARPAQADLFREVVLSGLKSAHQHRSRQTDQSLWVSSDAHLVGSSLLSSKCRRGVVLIAGTGSVAVLLERRQLSYSEPNSDFPFVERRRAGGLGYLLGDEGSAYSIGREALRFALSSESRGQEDEPFRQSIMGHFGVVTIGNLVSAVYDASSLSALDGGSATVKSRIADLSPLVLDVAFPRTDQSFTPSSAAIQIVSSAISALIVLVRSVLHAADTDDTALAITGGLFRDEFFRRGFTKELEEQGMCFGEFVFVEEPGRDAGGWFAEDAVYRLSK